MGNVLARRFRTALLGAAALAAFIHPTNQVYAADAWPADAGVDIADAIAAAFPGFEPSGIVYHPGLDRLIVVSDEGDVCVMTTDGADSDCVDLGSYDLEGVTVVSENSSLVYLAIESPDAIFEFDATALRLTGRSWDLTTWLTGADNAGIEALAFVPNEAQPFADSNSGGLFYAGLQADGTLHVFDVNLSGTGVSQVAVTTPVAGYTDLADLSWNPDTEKLYGVYDANNVLVEMSTDAVVTKSYNIIGNDQEGIALMADCTAGTADIYVAWDSQPVVMQHSGYPVTCPAVEPEWSPIEFAGNKVDDDGDGLIDEENTLAENGAHPTFSALSPSLSSSYTTAIKSVVASTKGSIVVTYTDNSIYRYTIFSGNKYSTRVTRVSGTAYYKVRLSYSLKYVRVNVLKGTIE